MSDELQNDPFIGISLNEFVVKSKCGQGSVASVYFAERESDIPAHRAIKFIEKDKLKEGWQNEIIKVKKTQRVLSNIWESMVIKKWMGRITNGLPINM